MKFNFLRSRKHHTPEPAKSDTDPLAELLSCFKTEGGMPELNMDKLTEVYALRIPDVTLKRIGGLSSAQKKQMNEQNLIAIARYLHESSFDPVRYLVEDYDTRNGAAR